MDGNPVDRPKQMSELQRRPGVLLPMSFSQQLDLSAVASLVWHGVPRHFPLPHLTSIYPGPCTRLNPKRKMPVSPVHNCPCQRPSHMPHLSMSMADGGGANPGKLPGGAFFLGLGALPSPPSPPPNRLGFLGKRMNTGPGTGSMAKLLMQRLDQEPRQPIKCSWGVQQLQWQGRDECAPVTAAA